MSASAVQGAVEVIKSPQDKKLYRYMQLPSGMSVLLIHDPEIVVKKDGSDVSVGDAGVHDSKSPSKKRQKLMSKHEDEGDDEDAEDEGEDDEDEGEDEDDEGEDDDEDEGEDEDEDDDEDEGEEGEEEEGEDGGMGKKRGGKHEVQKKAAAAMAVGIGSFSDPEHMQGISHYLEHMLFMGSTKYPDENEYDEFLTKHGGSSNAYTELEYTDYHFEVSPDALHGALDRFAQFFMDPLFKEDSLEREVLAVDSEFSGVVQNDQCRLSQLICHTAVENHMYRKFSWGNKKSLWDNPREAGIDIRSEIVKYYNKHYCAERMTLVLMGGEPLDTLSQWVTDIFSHLPTGKGSRPDFKDEGMPFKGRNFYAMPAVREHHEIAITFQLPCLHKDYHKKVDHYISHLVGHEGPGSLLSALKARGWATEVSAGMSEEGHFQNSACFLFTINIILTEAGLAAGPRGLGLAAVELAFQYLQMLVVTGPKEWVWRELKAISEMKFMFQEEDEAMDYVTTLSATMHLYKPEHVLVADYLHTEWDPEMVTNILGMMHPTQSSYRIDLLTKDFSKVKHQISGLGQSATKADEVSTVTEPWFGLEAAFAAIPDSLATQWASTTPLPELHLPPANPYVPTDFTLLATEAEKEEAKTAVVALAAAKSLPVVLATPPTMIVDQPGLRVWHKLDATFCTPRANVFFRIASDVPHASPRASAQCHMMLKLVEDSLTEDSYLADVAGLQYGLAPEGQSGIEIKFEGFSHKLPLLAERIFSCLVAATFDATSFANVKEALLRKYRNTNMTVHKHAAYNRLYMLCKGAWHVDEVLRELETLELADFKPFMATVLKSCHLESLVHGNMSAADAAKLSGAVHALLGAGCNASAADRLRDQCAKLEKGVDLMQTQLARNPEEENCGYEGYFQCLSGTESADRALLDLLEQIVSEPTYNQLRTKEQLGYSVHSGVRMTHGVMALCFTVVSAKFPSEHVDARVEAFIQTFYEEKLQSMSVEDFEKQKASVVSMKLQRDRSLHDESVRHWESIWSQRYDFLARERDIAALETTSLDSVQSFYKDHLMANSPSRRKLTIQVQPVRLCAASSDSTPHANAPAPTPANLEAANAGAAAAAAATQLLAAGAAEHRRKRVVVSDMDTFRKETQYYPKMVTAEPVMGAK